MPSYHAQLQQQAMQLSQMTGEPVAAFNTDFGGLVEINRQMGLLVQLISEGGGEGIDPEVLQQIQDDIDALQEAVEALEEAPGGGEMVGHPVFVQSSEPDDPGPYFWVKTGVTPVELWFHDGEIGA